jgi:coenzyme PQQ precursor peptide PqqA
LRIAEIEFAATLIQKIPGIAKNSPVYARRTVRLKKPARRSTGNLPKASRANPCFSFAAARPFLRRGISPLQAKRNKLMSWTTPTLVEVCIGLEINGYLPAEF